MKRTQLVLSVLALGLSGLAQAGSFPADAEAVSAMPEARYLSLPSRTQDAFPADGEALVTVQARGSYAERHAGEAVKQRAEPTIAAVNLDD